MTISAEQISPRVPEERRKSVESYSVERRKNPERRKNWNNHSGNSNAVSTGADLGQVALNTLAIDGLIEEIEDSFEVSQATLESDMRLDFDHGLIDPVTNKGFVKSTEVVDSISMAGNALLPRITVHEMAVIDPFVAADPRGYRIIKRYIDKLEDAMNSRGYDPLIEKRNEAVSRNEQNRFTRAWLKDPRLVSIGLWRDLVPSALALHYLVNPTVGGVITNRDGESAVITPEAAAELRFVDDAIAIRDRKVAMEAIAAPFLERRAGQKLKWLSMASGTAEPSIAVCKHAADEYGTDIDLTLVDYDSKAIELIEMNAAGYGYESKLTPINANILSPKLADKIRNAIKDEPLFDVVENMGFEEYLPEDGDTMGAYKTKGEKLLQASEFTRRAFDLVKPGGILISGNMILDRPQRKFVFGVVDWPLINARSEEEILRIYDRAGILNDPNAKVEIFRVRNHMTGVHIYNIVRVTKLA